MQKAFLLDTFLKVEIGTFLIFNGNDIVVVICQIYRKLSSVGSHIDDIGAFRDKFESR